MLAGTAYGVVLNDRAERVALSDAFTSEPYRDAPKSPVLYIKPRLCAVPSGSRVEVPDSAELIIAPTLALLFGRDATRSSASQALEHVAAVRLALDISQPHASYFRPAIAERCRDAFLPLGNLSPLPQDISQITIHTLVDDREVHSWSLGRLAMPVADLVEAISVFMTLSAGDLLLVGLPGDAPRARAGQIVKATASGIEPVEAQLVSPAVL